MNGRLTIWTIYRAGNSAPVAYLARRWEVDENGATPTPDVIRDTLENLRNLMWSRGLIRFARDDEDETSVVESWV